MTARSRHPKALTFLFLTELWERFGFYVVQGMLVLYMTQYFGYTDNESYGISSVFTALAYISPMAGGYLANKRLGFKTAIVWGGLFLIIGYALLALPYANALLHPALATIIVGNGLFKPSISSLLGCQYSIHDPRRDSGFTIFYIGINIGAFMAGLSSGYIKEYFGWRTSFGLASLGIIIGIATFIYGLKYIKNQQHPLKVSVRDQALLVVCSLLMIVCLSFLLKIKALATYLLPGAGLFLVGCLMVLTIKQEREYRTRMWILNILTLSSIVFWMLYLQLFYSANLFVDRLVDKNFMGLHLTTTIFWASASIFIILLGPIFAYSWQTLGDNDKNPSPITKFALGIFMAGLGFIVLTLSTLFVNENGLVNPLWVFFSYFLITIGELLLSPIGLSAVTTLAPANLVGMMMGVWFVATGFGSIFGGIIAKMASVPEHVQTSAQKLAIYQHAFLNYAYIAFVVGACLLLLRCIVMKMQASTSPETR